MSIYRKSSGLIFHDEFDTLHSRWNVSPSDSYSLSDGGATLNHSDSVTNMLFDLPSEEQELLFEVVADYTPTEFGDEGGLVVWKSAQEKLEFLESMDTTDEGEYSIWRVTKQGNLWSFFAKKGNAWKLFDSSVCISPLRAGVVVHGEKQDTYVPLTVDRAILCRGDSIMVGNVSTDYKVELIDSEGIVVDTQVVPEGFAGIEVKLPSVPFTGHIKSCYYDEETSSYQ